MKALFIFIFIVSYQASADVGHPSEVVNQQFKESRAVGAAMDLFMGLFKKESEKQEAIYGNCWVKLSPTEKVYAPCTNLVLQAISSGKDGVLRVRTNDQGKFAFKALEQNQSYQIKATHKFEIKVDPMGPLRVGTNVNIYLESI